MCCLLSCRLPDAITCICVFCSVLSTVSRFWEATLPAMHRWGLSISNGLLPHAMATIVLSFPTQMAATVNHNLIKNCMLMPATATPLLLTLMQTGCSRVARPCVYLQLAIRTLWSVFKTICHSCPGEKDASSCAKEAPEGPPSPG